MAAKAAKAANMASKANAKAANMASKCVTQRGFERNPKHLAVTDSNKFQSVSWTGTGSDMCKVTLKL